MWHQAPLITWLDFQTSTTSFQFHNKYSTIDIELPEAFYPKHTAIKNCVFDFYDDLTKTIPI